MRTERKTARASIAVAAMLALAVGGTTAAPAQAGESFASLFTEGQGGLAFRYRLENVYQDNYDENAIASTLRTRLNFKSGLINGWGFFVEYDYILPLGWDNYNEGAGNTPDRVQYPVVADPEGYDLNQAYINWAGDGYKVRGGRTRITYDNQRFVGNVGWRQNEQTYDGFYGAYKVGGLDLQGAWVYRVNRIFGRDVPAGRQENNTWLLNGSYKWDGIGKLVGYYYDIDNKDSAAFSTVTYGARFTGNMGTDKIKFGYAAEAARQDDAHNNPVNYSADYLRIDLSLGLSALTPYINYESLGGDDTRSGAAFRTPLATLHAFNGWADKFLATPGAGLEDLMLGVKGKLAAWNWNFVWHDFDAESGNASFGEEVDVAFSRKMGDHFGLLLKAAWFNAEQGSAYDDTTKLWVQVTANL